MATGLHGLGNSHPIERSGKWRDTDNVEGACYWHMPANRMSEIDRFEWSVPLIVGI